MSEVESTKEIVERQPGSLVDRACKREGCGGTIPAGKTKCAKCGIAPVGGWRPGGGFPLGKKTKKTLEKMKVKAAIDQRIMQHADRLFNAQMNLAVGEQVLMVKITEDDGKRKKVRYEQVTDPETVKRFLDDADGSPTTLGEEGSWYYLSTKPANNQAIDSLLNRGLGKPTEKIEIEGGFFKADKLIIEVHNARSIEPESSDDDIIEIEPEAEAST